MAARAGSGDWTVPPGKLEHDFPSSRSVELASASRLAASRRHHKGLRHRDRCAPPCMAGAARVGAAGVASEVSELVGCRSSRLEGREVRAFPLQALWFATGRTARPSQTALSSLRRRCCETCLGGRPRPGRAITIVEPIPQQASRACPVSPRGCRVSERSQTLGQHRLCPSIHPVHRGPRLGDRIDRPCSPAPRRIMRGSMREWPRGAGANQWTDSSSEGAPSGTTTQQPGHLRRTAGSDRQPISPALDLHSLQGWLLASKAPLCERAVLQLWPPYV